MKMRTSELTGVALDWAVAKCEGWQEWDAEDAWESAGFFAKDGDFSSVLFLHAYSPTTDWAQGGPIIGRERISIDGEVTEPGWYASICDPDAYTPQGNGPTPLIAAMRCYVTTKLGPEIEIPDELGAQP